MPLRVDSKAAIAAMIGDARTFPTVAAALDKDVPKYLAAHFKDKGMGLDRLKATHDALGRDNLDLVLESLDDKAVTALLKKADPYRAPSGPVADVAHLKGLASGGVEPLPKPEKAKKAAAPRAKPPLKRAGADKAAGAKGTGTVPTETTGESSVPAPDVTAPAKGRRGAKKAPPKDR